MEKGQKGSYEKVSVKAGEQVSRDASEATRKALDGVSKDLEGRGFRREDLAPWIREGAREATENHR